MDPISACASISGLVIAIEQIIAAIYKYSKGVKDAKKETKQLCSELFALKAGLEHIRLDLGNTDDPLAPLQAPASPTTGTTEFDSMLDATKTLLESLDKRFKESSRRFNTALHRLAWPLRRDDIKYFILATTTDNLYATSFLLQFTDWKSIQKAFKESVLRDFLYSPDIGSSATAA